MFLKNLTVKNYKSLKDVNVSFQDGLNIIIGKNGSGKSNLLKFISETLGSIIQNGKRQRNLEYSFTFEFNNKEENLFERTIRLSAEIPDQKKNRTIDIINKNINGDTKIESLEIDKQSISREDKILRMEIIRSVIFPRRHISFNIPIKQPLIENPIKCQVDEGFIQMEESFSSLFLNILWVDFEEAFNTYFESKIEDEGFNGELSAEEIVDFFLNFFKTYQPIIDLNITLRDYTPLQEIRLNPNINSYLVGNEILIENLLLEFKINETWVPWSYLSDGTQRLFHLFTECLSLGRDGQIVIDEPELGIHPHQLYKLMHFLRRQAETKQVIIATHSPIVLDALKPDELDRITIAKIDEQGYSQFVKLGEQQKEKARTYMHETAELSYYWLHSDLEEHED